MQQPGTHGVPCDSAPMNYLIHPSRPMGAEVRRVLLEQIDFALWELARDDDMDRAVLEARKCFKRIRALLRLAGNQLGGAIYHRENQHFRSLARRLSELRERRARVDTLQALPEQLRRELRPDTINAVDQLLREGWQRALHDRGAADRDWTLAELQRARSRITADWPELLDDFASLYDGLEQAYAAARHAMDAARTDPAADRFHTWRKRAKDLSYQVRLLRPSRCAPPAIGADPLHELTEILGEEHDCQELRIFLAGDCNPAQDTGSLAQLTDVLARRGEVLRALARRLGERLYAAQPADFVRHLRASWSAARAA